MDVYFNLTFKCAIHAVQLSIKSFKVPEVIIEVSESTTIETLKGMQQQFYLYVKIVLII